MLEVNLILTWRPRNTNSMRVRIRRKRNMKYVKLKEFRKF